jgi:hypothetical protein
MISKCMTFLYRNILSAGSADKSSGHTHTHTVKQYKQHNDLLYGKEHTIQCRLLTSPCCSCVFVYLSAAFKFLNHLTDCYKSVEKSLMELEALGHLRFQFQYEVARWRHCICLVEFSLTMKIYDWEQASGFWYGGKLFTCLQILYKIWLIKMYMG